MDILKLLQGQLDLGAITGALSKNLKTDQDKVEKATSSLLPELLSGMSKNVKEEKGLNSLFSALDDHQNADVKDVNNFLSKVDLSDGQKILGHLLGNDQDRVEKKVVKDSGLAGNQVNKLMAMLAPLLMGFLGNQKKNQSGFNPGQLLQLVNGLSGGNGLTNLLGSLVGTSSGQKEQKKDLGVSDAVNIVGNLFKKK